MSNLLALDTSTDACSVALQCGEQLLARHHVEPRAHNRVLLGLIDELMQEAGLVPAQLDGIAFGRGPGSFTGLRIAVSVVQGIAWAADVPVLAVSTLEVLAATAVEQLATPATAGVVTLLDARMGECYWNAFRVTEDAGLLALAQDRLVRPETLQEQLMALPAGQSPEQWALVGDGLRAFSELDWLSGWPGPQRPELLPDARQLLALAMPGLLAGEGRPATEAVPHYLRDERRWQRLDQQPTTAG